MPDEIYDDLGNLLPEEPHAFRGAVADEIRAAREKAPEQTHAGPLPAAQAASGHVVDPARREFSISIAMAAAIGAVEILTAAAGWYETRRGNEENRAVANDTRLGIRRDFAEHVATVNYRSPDPLAGYNGPLPLSQGERAVIDSMCHLRDRKMGLLEIADGTLGDAVKASTDPHGKAIGLTRLAIDASFRGDGEAAQGALAQIPFEQLASRAIILRAMDFGTSVALNAIDPHDFGALASKALANLELGWNNLKIDHTEASDIAALAPSYGVGVFTIAQRAGMKEVSKALAAGSSLEGARDRWFELVRRTGYALDPHLDRSVFGEDLLYSLHRPTFHASAAGHHAQAKSLLDYYLHGVPNDSGFEGSLNDVRAEFGKNMPGSSPWMFLLEVRYEQNRKLAVEKVRRIASLSKSQPPQFKKALTTVWARLGLPRKEILATLNVKEVPLGYPPTTIHRVYMNQVAPFDWNQ